MAEETGGFGPTEVDGRIEHTFVIGTVADEPEVSLEGCAIASEGLEELLRTVMRWAVRVLVVVLVLFVVTYTLWLLR